MKILLVDDDDSILQLLSGLLQSEGHYTETSTNVGIAQALLQKEVYDLLITDMAMPGEDSTLLTKYVKETSPQTAVLAMTGLIQNGVDDFMVTVETYSDETLNKPFKPHEFMAAVERVTGTAVY